MTQLNHRPHFPLHDDIMTWRYFPHYWPFVSGNLRLLSDSLHKGPLMLSFDVPLIVILNKLSVKQSTPSSDFLVHDDVSKWNHFPRYWRFVRGIHRSAVNSPHKDKWRGALMFSLICVWVKGWVKNRRAGDLRRYRAHYDVTVMSH